MNKTSILALVLLCAIMPRIGAQKVREEQSTKMLSFCPEPQLLYKQEADFPFAYFWRRDYIDIRKFDKILIKPPINQLSAKFDPKKINKEQLEILKTEITALNEQFLTTFAAQIRSIGRFIELRQTEKPDAKTMILEVAFIPLMDLDSFYSYLNYKSTKTLTVNHLPHGLISAGFFSIEAVVKDHQGELIAQLGSILPAAAKFNVNDKKTWTDSADAAIKKWNKDFIAIIKAELNRNKDGIYISISGKSAKLKTND